MQGPTPPLRDLLERGAGQRGVEEQPVQEIAGRRVVRPWPEQLDRPEVRRPEARGATRRLPRLDLGNASQQLTFVDRHTSVSMHQSAPCNGASLRCDGNGLTIRRDEMPAS